MSANSPLFPPRGCPVCGAGDKRLLFSQQFGTLSRGSLLSGYDVVACVGCGAGYADHIPAQSAFDNYYAEMSKYEYGDRGGIPSKWDLQRFRAAVDLVAPHLRPDHRILDIGCATGGLLAEFKRRGFFSLLGVDPSPSCAQLAQDLHGIPSLALSISALDQLGDQFDAVFLTGVLEHVCDVDAFLEKAISRLRSGGALCVAVPDATRFDHHVSAPFQFFSMEHVNFLSPSSLGRSLARHKFSSVFSKRLIVNLGPKSVEPVILGLFRMNASGEAVGSTPRDDETEPALQRYIHESRGLERSIQQKIARLARSGRRLAVWGAGTHTLRLMETSPLRDAAIIAFIDSNVHYQGKTLAGIPIVSPSMFSDATAEILISSQSAEDEIFNLIRQELHWPNAVHRLYNGQRRGTTVCASTGDSAQSLQDIR